jgi:hypothetical protein
LHPHDGVLDSRREELLPMKPLFALTAALAMAGLSGCVAPTGPVEVTRFHVPDISRLGKGTIAIEAAPGNDPASLEWRAYQSAVARQLVLLGYTQAPAGSGSQVALVRLARQTYRPGRSGSPVSVGLGGSTGSYGSGVGLGIGLNLAGRPKDQVETDLGVMIKDRASQATLWEGRAGFTVRAGTPLADTSLGAAKMAEALFAGFPGEPGESIAVK